MGFVPGRTGELRNRAGKCLQRRRLQAAHGRYRFKFGYFPAVNAVDGVWREVDWASGFSDFRFVLYRLTSLDERPFLFPAILILNRAARTELRYRYPVWGSSVPKEEATPKMSCTNMPWAPWRGACGRSPS